MEYKYVGFLKRGHEFPIKNGILHAQEDCLLVVFAEFIYASFSMKTIMEAGGRDYSFESIAFRMGTDPEIKLTYEEYEHWRTRIRPYKYKVCHNIPEEIYYDGLAANNCFAGWLRENEFFKEKK